MAANAYTHFTSPIRRYPDLIIHRILKWVLRNENETTSNKDRGSQPPSAAQESLKGSVAQALLPVHGESHETHKGRKARGHESDHQITRSPDHPIKSASHSPGESGIPLRFRAQQSHEAHSPWSKRAEKGSSARRRLSSIPLAGPISEPELHEIAESSSTSERAAAEAERELLEWKKLKFMEQRVGEDFDGLIVSVTKFGFFVELTELFIEGLVPLNSLTDDNYGYHENTRQIIGARSKKTYSIGDKVRVIVDRIDHMQKKVQFAVLEDKPKRSEKRHKKRG
ncbi:MAG: S1 RNA-binding domain-containing protein [Acidobacteriia bacterium]|nr:S1 RNA-binding domain-containing protein [Terriglobia bacterium]